MSADVTATATARPTSGARLDVLLKYKEEGAGGPLDLDGAPALQRDPAWVRRTIQELQRS